MSCRPQENALITLSKTPFTWEKMAQSRPSSGSFAICLHEKDWIGSVVIKKYLTAKFFLIEAWINALLATKLLEMSSFYDSSIFWDARTENLISLHKMKCSRWLYSFTFSHVSYLYQFGSDPKETRWLYF